MSETLCPLFFLAGIHSVFASNRIYCFVGTDFHLEEVVICLFAFLLCLERAAGAGSQADFKGGAWKATSGELQVGKRQTTGAKSLSLQEHHPLYLCQCFYIYGGHLESARCSGKQIKLLQKEQPKANLLFGEKNWLTRMKAVQWCVGTRIKLLFFYAQCAQQSYFSVHLSWQMAAGFSPHFYLPPKSSRDTGRH